MICRMASSRSSSVFFCAVMSRLVRMTLTACKKATSSRTALASSSVQHSVKALLMASARSAKRFLPSFLRLEAQHMVGRAGQRLVAAGEEAAVVEAMQHGAAARPASPAR
jgi:hypothetical protein